MFNRKMLGLKSWFTLALLVAWNTVYYVDAEDCVNCTTDIPNGNTDANNDNCTDCTTEKLNVSLARMSTVELIRSNGYTVEEHQVTTEDGYILTMQRIPASRNNVKGKKPVFLMHGLGCMSSSFVDRGNKSLGFVLADAGYDVWLGNERGNPNSMKHKDFDSNDPRFWSFSMDQISEYDIPAMWDAVLAGSKSSTLQHLGFATGFLAGVQALVTYPEYEKKIEHFVGLSPMSSSSYAPLPIQIPAHLGSQIKNIPIEMLSYGIELWDNEKVQEFVQGDCRPLSCGVFFGAMSGYNYQNEDESTFKNQALHCPAGSSLPYFIQFTQQMDLKRIQKYDHGILGNMMKYKSISPPGYDFSDVNTNVSLFVAANDPMANPLDVIYWEEQLTNLDIFRVPDPLFTHSDFLWGKNAPQIVYPEVIKSLK